MLRLDVYDTEKICIRFWNESLRTFVGRKARFPLRHLLLGAKPHLAVAESSVIASVAKANEQIGVGTGVVQSPNFFSYASLINNVEGFYGMRDESVALFFDSKSGQYDKSFALYLERLRRAARAGHELSRKASSNFRF